MAKAITKKSTLPLVEPVPHVALPDQFCVFDGGSWSVARLIECAKDLPEFDLPLVHMDLSDVLWEDCTPRQMAGHIIAVQNADPTKPIILCADGSILDGRHRVVKAIVEGRQSVRAVRFAENPAPCVGDDPGG